MLELRLCQEKQDDTVKMIIDKDLTKSFGQRAGKREAG